MPLIKNDRVIDDPWLAVADEAEIPLHGAVLLGVARWQAERTALVLRNAALGVRLDSGHGPEDIVADLDRLALVAIPFPSFSDGRPYSIARLLRERYAFSGELRAVGAVLPDQIPLMRRCGFDSFVVDPAIRVETVFECLGAYDRHHYQAAADGVETIAALRRRAPGKSQTSATAALAAELETRFGNLPAEDLVAQMVVKEFKNRIAYVSSFGTEAAVLLHMVALADPATPVLFLDTGKLFPETLAYRDALVDRLGLSAVRTVTPDQAEIAAADAGHDLCRCNPDLCCTLRKVKPLDRALTGFAAWLNGRKGYHGTTRIDLSAFEVEEDRIKINPLRHWGKAEVGAWFATHHLPRHPLEAKGFLSIGCMPCTDRVAPGEDIRAGRWRGQDKTECGLHNRPTGAV
ncbi:MAG: phosphoadenosine phosphosulfate reductase [Rhodospirillaceae bacterium]|nr:MAG: phosphoadenosine phosphosulfate reductase [Rhodospirillaceae bacterium]